MKFSRSDLALAILRLALGVAFVAHGLPKIAHLTAASSAIAALIEFGGGLAVLAGIATRPAAFLLAADMVVEIFVVLVPRGAAYVSAKAGASTFELPLAYLAVASALLLIGPGALSIDGLRARRSSPRSGRAR